MHKALATPSKQALRLCRCMIQSDKKINFNLLPNEGTKYTNVQTMKVLFHNLVYKPSNLYCAKDPISQNLSTCKITPFTGSLLFTNSNVNNVKKIHYLMRRALHWQHWKQQKENSSEYGWKISRPILGAGAVACAVYALYEYLGISPSRRHKQKPIDISKYPAKSEDIPYEVEYLIVGGGAAAFSASRTIKGRDATAKILIISKEPHYPYMKPPLSKELLFNQNREMAENLTFPQWNGSVRSIFFEVDAFYTPCEELAKSETGGVAVARGWKVESIDPHAKTVKLEDGKTIKYGKCLLATGSTPTKLKVIEDQPNNIKERITYYNSLSDFKKIDHVVKNGAKTIAIFGNGLLCCELACAMALRGKSNGVNVMIVMPSKRLMQDILPPYLCDWLKKKFESMGITVIRSHKMKRFAIGEKNMLKIALSQKRHLDVDHLIVCTASKANTEIAEASHLEVDAQFGGFFANSELAISSNLYAAGDCASYYDEVLQKRRNLLQYDNAVVTGRIAGENMTGAEKPLHHQAMLWSELGSNVGFEAVGILDSGLKTAGYFRQPDHLQEATEIDTESNEIPPKYCHKGVIFYLQNEYIEGILLWNLYDRLGIARQILAERKKYPDLKEVAKLFEVYKD